MAAPVLAAAKIIMAASRTAFLITLTLTYFDGPQWLRPATPIDGQ
jgi:hypothetical protein